MKNRFDVIIFDWDGTLVNSIDWIVHCVQRAAAESRCQIPESQAARDIIGLSLKNAIKQLFPGIDADAQQRLVKSYSEQFLSRQIDRDDLFDGVYDMLISLKQAGYQLAVATGKTRAGLDRALLGTGIADLFCVTRCADETQSKPDPAMVNEIIKHLGSANDRTLMVGDSVHDLQMAVNAEIAAVGVSCGAHSRDVLEKHNPLLCLQHTTELIDFL